MLLLFFFMVCYEWLYKNQGLIMFFIFLKRFFFIIFFFCIVKLPLSGALFEGMKMNINQQLIVCVQKLPNRFKTQQLQYSVFSQLQGARNVQHIINTVDLILTQIKKEQNPEIELLFSAAIVSYMLSLLAKKLYVSIAKIRSIINYWKKIDNYSLLHYMITHSPQIWDIKVHNDFQIKQKIMLAENICRKYIARLGHTGQLTQHMPKDILDNNGCISWMNEALTVIYSCCGQKYKKMKTEEFDAKRFFRDFKIFLTDFDSNYNAHFNKDKESIAIPSYTQRSFGKIVFTVTTLLSSAFSMWYKWAKVVQGSKDGYAKFTDLFENWIKEPVSDSYETVFPKKEKNEENKEENKAKEIILEFKKLLLERKKKNMTVGQNLDKKIKEPDFSAEDINKLKKKIKKRFGDYVSEEEIARVVENLDTDLAHKLAKKTQNAYWSSWNPLRYPYQKLMGKDADLLTRKAFILPELIKFKAYSDKKDLLQLALAGSEGLDTAYVGIDMVIDVGLEKIEKFEKETQALRLIGLLTPTVFTVLGSAWSIKKIYNFFTVRDYSILKRALKELETVTICSIKVPNNHENYGTFVFLLENLKLGVARISNSRYTKKEELLEDLKRLDLSDLSFKERHKLISLIKESYAIFR